MGADVGIENNGKAANEVACHFLFHICGAEHWNNAYSMHCGARQNEWSTTSMIVPSDEDKTAEGIVEIISYLRLAQFFYWLHGYCKWSLAQPRD